MRTISLLILCSLVTSIASAQSTTVQATVVDQNSVAWANGKWALDFVPNPNSGSPPYWNGNPFPTTQWHYSGALDGNGFFSQSVPSNSFITPSGSTYTVTVCPNATAPCSTILRETFQGTSMDISSTITGNTPGLSVKPYPVAVAYNDNEVNVNASQVGYFYQNATTNTPRYWNGAVWSNFGGSLNSVAISSLPPLFVTNVGGTASNPTFTFGLDLAIGNAVYGTCGGPSTAFPAFCALTAGMLPTTITSNTSGNAATATTATQLAGTPSICSGNNWSRGIAPNGNSTCNQVAFSNLSGNIAVNQMNSGTGATSTTFFAGDGTWKTATPGHDYYFNFTGCTITNTSNLNNCTGTVTWSSVGLGSATVTGADYLGCTVGTGNSYTASFSLGNAGMSSTQFVYYWTEIMANSGTASTPTMLCHLHTAA